MSTANNRSSHSPKRRLPSKISDSELEGAASQPPGEPEVEEVEPAEIEDRTEEPEIAFEKLVQKSARFTPEKVKRIVLSLLFVADKPLSIEQLHQSTGVERRALQRALESLASEHPEGSSGVMLQEVAGGWQLRTDPECSQYVRRFLATKPQRLTRAAVETLAIIAYRQPVTRPEVEDIRGVDSAAVIKALLERRLIKILGKKEEIGRPILYGTTREFLEFFGLKDLASLPTLREFHELSKEHQEIVDKKASPVEEERSVAALVNPEFQHRLEDSSQEAEGALAELEEAIATADQRAKSAADVLTPKSPPNAETAKPT